MKPREYHELKHLKCLYQHLKHLAILACVFLKTASMEVLLLCYMK